MPLINMAIHHSMLYQIIILAAQCV